METIVDGVTKDMKRATQKKFADWDEVVSKNILEEGTENEKRTVYGMLADPTVYAYAFFKNPNDTSQPFMLYPYQDLIINDPSKRVLFCAANQIGKSITLCLKGLHFALHNPGTTTVIVSLTFTQCKDLLLQIKNFLRQGTLDYKYDIGETETKTELYLRHYEEYEEYDEELEKTFTKVRELPQSRIICVPATGAALGYPVHLMLIDELAFFDDGEYFYFQYAQPRTYTTKGQIIVFSNPNGQMGIFWNLWNKKRFSKFRFKFLDCPTNTKKEYEELCSELTQERIDSTLDARFTSPEGGFLSLEERKVMQEDRPNFLPTILTRPVYIFYDFAKVRDRTVRVIGVPYGSGKTLGVHVYEMKEYPSGTSYRYVVEDLENLIKLIGFENVAIVGWDNSGVGSGIEDFLRRVEEIGVSCNPVLFTLQNKSGIYTIFKLLAERNVRGEPGIKIPIVQECDKQLASLRFERTSRDYLKIHHARESDRDDFPDALAGLCSLIVKPVVAPISAVIINDEPCSVGSEENLGFV